MGKKVLLFACIITISTVSFGQDNAEKMVRDLLTQQTKQWNNGDITSFMDTYYKSDSLMFIGKSGISYGWQKAMDNYKKNYPDTTAMGKLDFDLREVRRLSATFYFVVGKWHLNRSMGDIGGTFTLLCQKLKKDWVIVADHTSQNTP